MSLRSWFKSLPSRFRGDKPSYDVKLPSYKEPPKPKPSPAPSAPKPSPTPSPTPSAPSPAPTPSRRRRSGGSRTTPSPIITSPIASIGKSIPITKEDIAKMSTTFQDLLKKERDKGTRVSSAIRAPTIKSESFVPSLGFGTAFDPSGQGTMTFRQPTLKEQLKIESAKQKGSFAGIMESIQKKEADIEKKLFGERKKGAPTQEQQRKALKEKFPPIKVFEFGAEATVLGGEALGGLVTGKPGRIEPGARKITKQIIEDLFIISAFSPLIETGTAQQTKQQSKAKSKVKEKVKKKEKITKKDIKDILEAPEQEGNIIKSIGKGDKNYRIKAERAKNLLKAAKGDAGRVEALKIIRESYGDSFVKDFISQEGISFGTKAGAIPAASQTSGAGVVIEIPRLSKIPLVPETITAATIPSSLKQKLKPIVLDNEKMKQAIKKQNQKLKQTLTAAATLTVQALATAQDTLTIQQQDTLTTQQQKTKQRTQQQTATTQLTVPKLATTQMTAQKLATKQLTMQKLRTPTAQKLATTQLIVPKLRPLISEQQLKKKMVQAIKPSLTPKKQFYIPEAKRNEKWVKLAGTGLTKQAALGRGARVVDNTVAAAFRIRPVEKGSKKVIDNYFAFNKKKFRNYKIVKGQKIPLTNQFIEKRGISRIDQKSEKDGLTISKYLKRQGWAGKKKTKPSKVMRSKLDMPKDIANALKGKI